MRSMQFNPQKACISYKIISSWMQYIGQVQSNIIAFRDKSFAKLFIKIKTSRLEAIKNGISIISKFERKIFHPNIVYLCIFVSLVIGSTCFWFKGWKTRGEGVDWKTSPIRKQPWPIFDIGKMSPWPSDN